MLSVECCDRKWKAAVSSLLTSGDGERRVSLSNTGHHRAHLLAEPSWENVCLSIRLSKRKVDGGKPLICLLACLVPQGLGSINRFGSLVCCSCRLPLAVAGKEINDAALPDSSASAATSSPWLPSPRWPQIIQGLITKGNSETADVTNMIVFLHPWTS